MTAIPQIKVVIEDEEDGVFSRVKKQVDESSDFTKVLGGAIGRAMSMTAPPRIELAVAEIIIYLARWEEWNRTDVCEEATKHGSDMLSAALALQHFWSQHDDRLHEKVANLPPPKSPASE